MAARTLLFAILGLTAVTPAFSQQIDLAGGFNFQNSDQGEGMRTNLNGWYASGQYDFNEHVALTLEADNYYGVFNGQSERQQNFVFGPQYMFLKGQRTTRPFLYLQLGDQRSSTADSVDHAINLQVGGGFQIMLSDRFALQLAPAEYSFVETTTGPTHSFSAKAGLSWTAWKKTKR